MKNAEIAKVFLDITEPVATGRLGYYEKLKAEFPEKVNSTQD